MRSVRVPSARRDVYERTHSVVGCFCYVARLHVSLVSHHTSLPFQLAARRATSLSTVQQTSNRRTCPSVNGFRLVTVKALQSATDDPSATIFHFFFTITVLYELNHLFEKPFMAYISD